MFFVGLDVHVRNSYFHVTDESGQRLRSGRCGNSAEEFTALWAALAAAAAEADPDARTGAPAAYAVLETTTNARAIRNRLQDCGVAAGVAVVADVLDARKLRIIAESVTKCDAVDARILNELARANLKLPRCYLPTDDEFAMRERLRGRHDLVRIRTMLKNRVSAVLHRRALPRPKGGLWTQAGRAYLAQLELDAAGRELLDRLTAQVDQLDGVLAAATQSLRQEARTPRWAKPAALLQTIPGVGLLTALTILAELGELQRFKSRSAVSNYAGLVPIERSSNQKRYQGGITHRGPAHLRAVLIEAAWFATTRVPAYEALFQRVAAKKNKLVAVVAVARRLLEDAWTMLRRDEAFRFVPVPKTESVAASVAG